MTKKNDISSLFDGANTGVKSLSYYLGHGYDSLHHHEPAEALKLAVEGITYYPDNVELLTMYGHTLCLFDQHHDAEVPLRTAVALEPTNVSAIHCLAVCLQQLSKEDKVFADEALNFYAQALKINPNKISCRHDYGLMLFQDVGNYAAAGEQFQAILDIEPDNPIAHTHLGICRMQMGLNDNETHKHLRLGWQNADEGSYLAGYYYIRSLLYADNRPMALMIAEFVLPRAMEVGHSEIVNDLRQRLPELAEQIEHDALHGGIEMPHSSLQ